MRIGVIGMAVSVLSVLLFASASFGQGFPPRQSTPSAPNGAQGVMISGRVYLPNGRPIERSVRVELRAPRFSSQTIDTDNNGSFSFRALTPGNYVVSVDAGEEFEIATETITIDDDLARAISMTPTGRSDQIAVYLRQKRTSIIPAASFDAKLANVPKKALDLYGKGLKLASDNKFAEAVVELRKAIQTHPGFFQAQVELGKVYLKLSRFDEASAAFRAALASEPTNFPARFHLGMALLSQKKFEEALPELTLAADLDKSAATPHYYIGVIKYETGRFEHALLAFEKAKEVNGDKPFPHLHKYLASLYLKNSKWALAVAELETYLAEAPNAQDAEKIRSTIAEARSKIK
jgi:Flp pilus assembly protein TadD